MKTHEERVQDSKLAIEKSRVLIARNAETIKATQSFLERIKGVKPDEAGNVVLPANDVDKLIVAHDTWQERAVKSTVDNILKDEGKGI